MRWAHVLMWLLTPVCAGAQTPAAVPAGAGTASPAATAPSPPPRPGILLLRGEEDWRPLRDPAARVRPLDDLKAIALGPDATLSLGADARFVYEWFDEHLWGAGPQDDDGFLLHRYFLHADLRVGPSLRAFASLTSALEDFRTGGPRPIDENQLDLHQAFAELRLPLGSEARLALRPGRQELNLGAARLVAVRNGPNDRLSFDAARATLELGAGGPPGRPPAWRIDAFWSRPVETDRGVFDDDALLDDQHLWGVYSTAIIDPAAPAERRWGFDAYYLGHDFARRRTQRGIGNDRRHTAGARLFLRRGPFDLDVEAALQTGDTRGQRALAGFTAINTGYTFADAPLSPRIGLEAGLATGDRGGPDGDDGTFNLLFARAGYFGELGILGNQNLVHLNPQVDLKLSDRVTLTAEAFFFWRASEDDGIYGPSGNLVRASIDGARRDIGVQPQVAVAWRPDPGVTVIATYAVLTAGGFIEDTGPDEDQHFVRVEVSLSF